MNFFKQLKRKWDNYLLRLAKTNEKLYGHKRMDCCDLNYKKKNTGKTG